MKIKAKHNDTRFCVIDEGDISGDLDKALRKSLVVCFPADREYFHRQSWWHCVPVYRIIGKDDKDSITAHVAVVERSVTVGRDLLKVLVAGVQSFCVLPDHRGTGLSSKMMSIALEEANRRGFDAGLLFCLDQLQTVYDRMGWRKLDTAVYMFDDKACRDLAAPGEPRREGKTFISAENITMFYPLRTRQFPPGDIDLNGTDW